jgi:hypothetical protein
MVDPPAGDHHERPDQLPKSPSQRYGLQEFFLRDHRQTTIV